MANRCSSCVPGTRKFRTNSSPPKRVSSPLKKLRSSRSPSLGNSKSFVIHPVRKARKNSLGIEAELSSIAARYSQNAVQEPKCEKNVKIHFIWHYLSFSLIVPESTELAYLETKIIEKHGNTIGAVTLFKDNITREANKLIDYNCSIKDVFKLKESCGPYSVQITDLKSMNYMERMIWMQLEKLRAISHHEIDSQQEDHQQQFDYECMLCYTFESRAIDCPILLRNPSQMGFVTMYTA
jgi:hypothetical protein